jgi:hypothetical protein
MRWIDRKFNFDVQVSLCRNVIERLRGTPARAEERVRGLSTELLTKRQGDSWSIQETIGHLVEVEDLWHGRLDDFDAGLEGLRPADMENRRTYAADYNSKQIDEILWRIEGPTPPTTTPSRSMRSCRHSDCPGCDWSRGLTAWMRTMRHGPLSIPD